MAWPPTVMDCANRQFASAFRPQGLPSSEPTGRTSAAIDRAGVRNRARTDRLPRGHRPGGCAPVPAESQDPDTKTRRCSPARRVETGRNEGIGAVQHHPRQSPWLVSQDDPRIVIQQRMPAEGRTARKALFLLGEFFPGGQPQVAQPVKPQGGKQPCPPEDPAGNRAQSGLRLHVDLQTEQQQQDDPGTNTPNRG